MISIQFWFKSITVVAKGDDYEERKWKELVDRLRNKDTTRTDTRSTTPSSLPTPHGKNNHEEKPPPPHGHC
jgi:hypothetical protein